MAKGVTCKVEGVAVFKSGLRKYLKLIEEDVDSSLSKASNEIVAEAKANCTLPSVAATISQSKSGKQYHVTTQGEHSAYLEFGTGNFAKSLLAPYPKDWKDMAMNFYINGLGRTPAQPYLYPAYQKNAGEAILEIENKIEGH